jgi:predicted nucleic acid-binding protein
MKHYYLDSSALVKRYLSEQGSEVLDALWQEMQRGEAQIYCQWLGFTEVVSALQRRLNARQVNRTAFEEIVRTLYYDAESIEWVALDFAMIQSSVRHIVLHNLNSTDALHLEAALSLPTERSPLIFVASDRRLLRAAAAENLTTLNPENATEGV